ncbi:hypothetical protein BUALT_Bualt18G0096100 [Buddleja alternifolia]|uniref:Uncharacterized protein n=1 Tax=Buddleja alternifolia TaxID=168488 RepID=A0AAV6WEA5_9LAMI|nr:hypothetical protein BUALT_Bualt18G0096100 [Buddleja alternifolia]
MLQHPRFCSLMVRDSCTGRERWRKNVVDSDRHLIILHHPISDDEDAFVLRILWVRDKTTALSGGSGMELWPRRLATARFRLDD